MYNEEVNIAATQSSFNQIFDFTHHNTMLIKNSTITFLSLMVVSALAFVGLLAYYWVKLRKTGDNGQSTDYLDMDM